AREHTAGRPKSPLRLIANVIKRSILEPLTSSPEGLKQDSDNKIKAASEQAFFSFPSTPGYSLSQRNSNSNRVNNTQSKELKVGERAGEHLENRSLFSNPSAFSVSADEKSPRDYREEIYFPVYSPYTRPSKTTSVPQKSSCTRMEDVPGLLEKFTIKETSPGVPMDDIFICNEKEGNSFVSSLPSMKDHSLEDRLRYPSIEEPPRRLLPHFAFLPGLLHFLLPKDLSCNKVGRTQICSTGPFEFAASSTQGCEHIPVRKQATEYSTSSSDDEFEPKTSLKHKAKRALRRRRKLEKETKQLIKQEELKRLHKAQAVQRQLEELEERQRALEIFGVKLERELRGES
ncbi:MICAL C-terminal-like, partial [Merops nubicus]